MDDVNHIVPTGVSQTTNMQRGTTDIEHHVGLKVGQMMDPGGGAGMGELPREVRDGQVSEAMIIGVWLKGGQRHVNAMVLLMGQWRADCTTV